MNSTSDPATTAITARRPAALLVVSILLAALVISIVAVRMATAAGGTAAPLHVPTAPTSRPIEALYGIRISQIGVTADGGILDMRFVVLDPEKAHQLGHGGVKMSLIVEDGNRLLDSEAMAPHGGGLRAGSTYFALFRNDGGLLRSGSQVTVVVGRLRLQHLTVL
jgi:hypothetical protein